mmetsp:Transcript_34952/g.62916  ORF Transcript_34952/g.62916 Transcript_34952/m.62916 type:complete len:184 (-) Transcript_34952:118-669(-)
MEVGPLGNHPAVVSSDSVRRPEFDDNEDDDAPLLTAEEEMQYQRALWVNRLLKEQLAVQTQGLSIKEIEEAQQQIQARMRDVQRLEAWPSGAAEPRLSPQREQSRSIWSNASPRFERRNPVIIAHSAVNRRKRERQIRQENSSFLRRLESVKSTFTPRICPPTQIRKLSPFSRLLGDNIGGHH